MFCLPKLEIEVICPQVQWLLKTIISSKWKADSLRSVGIDLSWCMTMSYVHSVFPMLLSCPSSGSVLSAGPAGSTSIFSELRMCRELRVKRCLLQRCLCLSQIKEMKELSVLDPGRYGPALLPVLLLAGLWLLCMLCKWTCITVLYKVYFDLMCPLCYQHKISFCYFLLEMSDS